ncbi:hypothetical protein [Pseudomonas sp. DP16D-R1]|jgi:hypothetical protein|uniref:hypothetical protein n=1 Tax=Pseudomonas sp. DP16D-R1 TaxID=2075551 RepID=UPI000CD2BDD3|nr:hypothetical protein [Pseudomonas sp. DP16D-R1]POA78654.1 hypothetical protein C1890_09995 [Pseudomonas sp. DP16D-R1]
MLSRNQKFTAIQGDVELTAEISPCVFMYPGYGLQLTVKLPNGGNTIVSRKDIPIETATEQDCQALMETVKVLPCKTCQKPAFDPSTCRTNRDGECESCFMAKLNAEFEKDMKKEDDKLKRDDAKYKARGYTHRVHAWIHPPSGSDYELMMWMINPTPEQITAELKKKKSADTTDYKLIEL